MRAVFIEANFFALFQNTTVIMHIYTSEIQLLDCSSIYSTLILASILLLLLSTSLVVSMYELRCNDNYIISANTKLNSR